MTLEGMTSNRDLEPDADYTRLKVKREALGRGKNRGLMILQMI